MDDSVGLPGALGFPRPDSPQAGGRGGPHGKEDREQSGDTPDSLLDTAESEPSSGWQGALWQALGTSPGQCWLLRDDPPG